LSESLYRLEAKGMFLWFLHVVFVGILSSVL